MNVPGPAGRLSGDAITGCGSGSGCGNCGENSEYGVAVQRLMLKVVMLAVVCPLWNAYSVIESRSHSMPAGTVKSSAAIEGAEIVAMMPVVAVVPVYGSALLMGSPAMVPV